MNKKATCHKPTITSGLVRAQGYQLKGLSVDTVVSIYRQRS